MSLLRFRLMQFVMAVCLAIALLDAPRPPGLLDGVVWPFGYGLAALCSFLLFIRPSRIFLHAWAALVITIGLIRGVLLFLNPTIPGIAFASLASNIFIAGLAYIVWGGWKDRLPDSEGNQVIQVPAKTFEHLLHGDSNPHTDDIKDELAAREQVIADELEQQSPTPDPAAEYRLPRVPGLN